MLPRTKASRKTRDYQPPRQDGGGGWSSEKAERILARDEEAMAEFYGAYRDRIYTLMYYGTSSRDDALDLTAQTFVSFLESLPRFRRQCNIATWLYSIAKNILKTYYYKKRRAEYVPIDAINDDGDGYQFELMDTGLLPDEELDVAEKQEIVQRAIAELNPDHQIVLHLRFVEGLSHVEMGRRLGRSEGATRILFFRANRAFVRALSRLARGGRELIAEIT